MVSLARGALEAGVAYAASYPGSPTAEVLGTLAKVAKEYDLYVEWSVNEKVAMEGAAAASFTGLRSLVALAAGHWNELGCINFYGKRSGHVAGPAGAGIGEFKDSVRDLNLTAFELGYRRVAG